MEFNMGDLMGKGSDSRGLVEFRADPNGVVTEVRPPLDQGRFVGLVNEGISLVPDVLFQCISDIFQGDALADRNICRGFWEWFTVGLADIKDGEACESDKSVFGSFGVSVVVLIDTDGHGAEEVDGFLAFFDVAVKVVAPLSEGSNHRGFGVLPQEEQLVPEGVVVP